MVDERNQRWKNWSTNDEKKLKRKAATTDQTPRTVLGARSGQGYGDDDRHGYRLSSESTSHEEEEDADAGEEGSSPIILDVTTSRIPRTDRGTPRTSSKAALKVQLDQIREQRGQSPGPEEKAELRAQMALIRADGVVDGSGVATMAPLPARP